MAPRKRARTAAATDPDAPAPIVLSGGAALPPAIVDLWNEGALCDAEIVAGGRASKTSRGIGAACSSSST